VTGSSRLNRFTLVELLVVIAILRTILRPALSIAERAALQPWDQRQTGKKASQKQLNVT